MIKNVFIKNFKSIKEGTAPFPTFGAIVGQNAAGKTNLIQAVNFTKSLVTGKFGDMSKIIEQMGVIPQELFNFNEPGSTLLISITLLSEEENNLQYVFEFEMKLQNGSIKTPTMHVVQEKLKKITIDGESQIYVRTENQFIDSESKQVPLAIDPDKFAITLYNDPHALLVKRMFSNILIPDIETVNSRETLVTGGDNEAGLASTLVKLMHGDQEAYNRFTKIVQHIMPAFSSMVEIPAPSVAESPPDKEKTYMVLLEERNLAGKLSIQSVSSGDLRTLYLIATAVSMPENSSLFIEEVENGLHPRRTLDVIEHLRTISIRRNVQIVFTTHSPKVINSLAPQDILFVEKTVQNGTKFKALSETDENSKVQRILDSGGQNSDYLLN